MTVYVFAGVANSSTPDEENNACSGGGGGGEDKMTDQHKSDEQVNVRLDCSPSSSLKSLKRKYIRCSTQATITHLKKYLALKLYKDKNKYKEVSNNEAWFTFFSPYTA